MFARHLLSLMVCWLFLTNLQANEIPDSLAGAVQRFVQKANLNDRTPGLAVFVNRGRVLHQSYVGMADLKTGKAIDAFTPFRLASVSKPFTATSIIQLAEKRKIQYHAPVQTYLPSFPWPDVTVHHLLTHTSGLPEYTSFEFMLGKVTNQSVLAAMKGKRLRFKPGSQMRYNNTGYAILALIVETVSRRPFPAYAQESIFNRAKLNTAIIPGLYWKDVPNRVVGYQRLAGRYFRDDHDTYNGVIGDGGVYASIADCDRWLGSVFSYKLCKKSSLDRALNPIRQQGGSFTYGYGWSMDRFSGQTIAWHDGSWVGFNTFTARVIGQKANVIVLSNAGLDDRGMDVSDLGFSLVSWLVANP